MTTYDCEPSLSDIDVSDFCVREFTILDSIVPPVINTRTLNYLEDYYAKQEPKIWEQTATLSTAIFTEEWVKDNVTLHPLVAVAIRSLLGKNFALPDFLSNHHIECPMPADIPGRSNHLWHRNELSGVNVPSLETVNFTLENSMDGAQHCLQVLYYPQVVDTDLDPSELLPGSHLVDGSRQYERGLLSEFIDD